LSNEIDNITRFHVHMYLLRNRPSSYEWQEITHMGPQDDHVFAPEKYYAIRMIIFFNHVRKYRDIL